MEHSQRKRMHPGYFLKQDLDTLEISAAEFSKRSGILEKQVFDLLNQKISVSKELAEKLAAFFGTSVVLWLGIQADYDTYQRKA